MIRRSLIVLVILLSFTAYGQERNYFKNFLLGKFDYRNTAEFQEVDKKYAVKPLYLNTVVYEAFREMFEAAKSDGINLKILSGTRTFEEQKTIWERKWKNLDSLSPAERAMTILEFSSMPATSRHHWGTDIDLNNLENSYFEEGKGKAEYEWLVQHAGKFGFYQVYTAQDSGRTGYREEKWHWSYLPLAANYLEEYNTHIDYCDIQGFEGSELAEETEMIENYVNGIAPYPIPSSAPRKIAQVMVEDPLLSKKME